MRISSFFHRRSLQIASSTSLLLFIVAILTYLYSTPRAVLSGYIPKQWRWSPKVEDHGLLPPPDDYRSQTKQSAFCLDRYSTKYFDDLRNRSTQYCSTDSLSRLTCFHSHTSADSNIDSLCVGSGTVYDFDKAKFALNCSVRTLGDDETSKGAVPFTTIRSYWYETGPRRILSTFFDLGARREVIQNGSKDGSLGATPGQQPASPSHVLLVKREGETNPWHTLMEIMSMSWTFDVLQMVRDPKSGMPIFQLPGDIENTQVVILDKREDGPYFDLWRLFSGRAPKRLAELSAGESSSWLSKPIGNIIIPLAGGSNPLWQNDWETRDCVQNQLLHTFVQRVLSWYDVSDTSTLTTAEIRVTFVDRKVTRRLVGHGELFDAVRSRFPNVQVQVVDFASLPVNEQLRVVRQTDILVGVHGAGLTNMMFMREGQGAIVEIQPEVLHHQGFRNLALMIGQQYFLAHGAMVDPKRRAKVRKRDAWHNADVKIEEDKFVHLMEMAIKSLYNKGPRNDDAV